jgi:hypothetical protein
MTQIARKVLADCRNAFEYLELEEDAPRFRVFWVAGVALMRAVGHVLDKVDGSRNPAMRAAVDAHYQKLKQNKSTEHLFWDFIENERNNILKEYEVGFLAGPIELMVLPCGEAFALGESLFCPLAHGHYAGEDCRDVMRDAIAWWEIQLNAIDKHANI